MEHKDRKKRGLNFSLVLEQSTLKMGEELPEATLTGQEAQPCPL